MGVEIFVLSGEECLHHMFGDRLNGHKDAPLAGIFGDEAPVARMDAGHDGRRIVRQMIIGRQVVGKAPQHIKTGQCRAQAQHNQPRK